MANRIAFYTSFGAAIALGGCATTELAPAAQSVRVISAEQAKACTFIDAINTNNVNTLTKNPDQDARNRAMNRIAEKGGNALLIKTTDLKPSPSGVGGTFSLTGEGYKCPG